MFKKHLMSFILIVLLMGLVFTSSPGNSASAQISTEGIGELNTHTALSNLSNLNQVDGGPGYIVLNAFDFVPSDWLLPPAFDGTLLYNPSPALYSYFMAPAHLPNGAVINKMVVYYLDNANPNIDLQVWLKYCPLAMDECVTVIYGVSAHADPSYRIMEASPGIATTVDLQSNSYLVQIYLPPGTTVGITGIRIDYSYPAMLPLIQK